MLLSQEMIIKSDKIYSKPLVIIPISPLRTPNSFRIHSTWICSRPAQLNLIRQIFRSSSDASDGIPIWIAFQLFLRESTRGKITVRVLGIFCCEFDKTFVMIWVGVVRGWIKDKESWIQLVKIRETHFLSCVVSVRCIDEIFDVDDGSQECVKGRRDFFSISSFFPVN